MRIFITFNDLVQPCARQKGVVIAQPQGPFISDLTLHLQRRLALSAPLALSIDGYTLPSCLSVCDILRDGDIVNVRRCCDEHAKCLSIGEEDAALHDDDCEPTAKRLKLSFPSLPITCDRIPKLNIWGDDRGRLIHALAICGVVFVRNKEQTGAGVFEMPEPCFAAWHALWLEALQARQSFRRRAAIRCKQLKFSQGEDLARTLAGSSKIHVADVRYNFGVAYSSLLRECKDWEDLAWIHRNFKKMFSTSKTLVKQEISPFVKDEPHETLGATIAENRETWAGSRLRHSVYPVDGGCTEHTDYGIITVQQSNAAGFEAYIQGQWILVQPPAGYFLVFGGDMLERLTNGSVPALLHRVRLQAHAGQEGDAVAARQTHILFLQPDRDTIVQPLKKYLRKDGTDLPPVQYGEWHKTKASLAFSR